MRNNTLNYYNKNAQFFFENTLDIDMSELYQEFTPHLAINDSILDAGCGSGRDTKYFLSQGFDVTAFDASKPLVDLASATCKISIKCMTFNDVNWVDRFSGIWACASLLHLNDIELKAAFSKLFKSLKSNGFLYCSFKFGENSTVVDGRYFNNKTNDTISKLLINEYKLSIKKTWITKDKRPDRSNDSWLNLIIKKD